MQVVDGEAPSSTVDIVGLSLGPKGSARPEGVLSIPRLLFGRMSVDPARLRWHQVSGDAMAPSLHDGDVVVVDLKETPSDGGMHVVALVDQGAAVRRVRSRMDGGFIVSCDNPSIRDHETTPAVGVIGVVILRMGVP